MIKRDAYINRLIQLKDEHLIKVITGIRRCGKSTLMIQFQDWLQQSGVMKKNIISLNFEERENSVFANWQDVFDHIIKLMPKEGTKYVFLDEVQTIPSFEKLVNALFVMSDIDLYITGSNAYLLSSEMGTLLSGRYIAINMHPFSFAEYAVSFPEEHNTDRLFRQYINGSCFPQAVILQKNAPEMENTYLKSLYETVVVKDIVQRHHLRKFDTLQRVIDFLFDSIGSVISPNNITESIRKKSVENLSHNTVLKYLRYFTESYLIYPVRLYNIKGKRLLESNYKYYVVDLGLKNILLTNAPYTDLGHKLENVVYFELLRRGGEVFAGRTKHGEVDFVVKKSNGFTEYYQVAYTANDEKTQKRELSSLREIKNSYPKYLLTMDFDNVNIDGIQKINVIDWLLNSKYL